MCAFKDKTEAQPQPQQAALAAKATMAPRLVNDGKPWARLIGIGPTAHFGIFDVYKQHVVIGNARKNQDALIRIEDPRIRRACFNPTSVGVAHSRMPSPTFMRCSGNHCKLFLDGVGRVQLLDDSSNGTWWNNMRMNRGELRTLSSMDNIILLHPSPTKELATQAASATTAGDEPGVVPRALNYQFMFIDLRPPPSMPLPSAAVQVPRLLHGTSLYAPAEDYGQPEDYETVGELGRGSFAVVRKVVHRTSGVHYAMKIMDKKKLLRNVGGSGRVQSSEEAKLKVLSEARILREVDHPNVIRFVDIFETDAHLHLVMELVEGGELFDRLSNEGAFAEPDARAIMHQLLSALKHLHARHIVHRDLKPENILLQRPPYVTADRA